MDTKRAIHIYNMEANCPISRFTDLLVYSVASYYDSIEAAVTVDAVSKLTTLGWRTVRRSFDRLGALGLYTPDRMKIVPAWFVISQTLAAKADHYSMALCNWRCYLRQHRCTLVSPLDVALWSYIRHRYDNGGFPARVWPAYFATVLRVTTDTISDSLKNLHDLGFLRYKLSTSTGLHFQLYESLNDVQMACLQDKPPQSVSNAVCVELRGMAPSPAIQAPPPPLTPEELVEQKRRDEIERRHGSLESLWIDLQSGITQELQAEVFKMVDEIPTERLSDLRAYLSNKLTPVKGWVRYPRETRLEMNNITTLQKAITTYTIDNHLRSTKYVNHTQSDDSVLDLSMPNPHS